MKLNSINQLGFRRAYTSSEKKDALKCQAQAMEILGNQKFVLIVPETSLPVAKTGNVGVGQLNSEKSKEFFDFAKTYMGANTIKVLPQGEMRGRSNGFYCNYNSSALTLGSNMINLEELTEKNMGEILSKETLKKVYANAEKTGTKDLANYENVVGPKSELEKALREAFDNFIQKNAPEISDLKQKFEKYKVENLEVLERKSLFDALSNKYDSQEFWRWPDKVDSELFDARKINNEVRETRIAEIKTKYAKEIEFSKFKQFLADENLAKAKADLNKKAQRLMGDCLIGFSHEETWGYPQAFEKATVCSEDWGLRSLNFAEITKDGAESNKLLKLKVKQFAKRYDDIRFDVGWGYVNPILFPIKNATLGEGYVYDSVLKGYRVKNDLKDDVLKIIENVVKSVKGQDYNLDNLIYEVEAGKEFSAFDWNNNKVIDALNGRTIVQSTCYMNDDYATIGNLEGRMKVPRKNYVLMAGNHDHLSLASLSKKIDIDDVLRSNKNDINKVFENQITPLARELKLQEDVLRKNPKEFVKAKFSHLFLAENIKMFFMDVFGRSEQFDSQKNNSRINYRYMVGADYEKKFFKALEEGKGFNIMESLAMAMRARGLDEKHPQLYKDLMKYSDVLKEKAPLRIGKGAWVSIGALSLSAIVLACFYKFKSNKTASDQPTSR